MVRAVTFVPSTGENEDLTYFERASRARSLHVLLQDCGTDRMAVAVRRRFLQQTYRELISKYLSFGRIEHPIALMRGLVRFIEGLSKGVDCRVTDFRGIGCYVLMQDGATFYLLSTRETAVRVRVGGGVFEDVANTSRLDVRDLPFEATTSQGELFSHGRKAIGRMGGKRGCLHHTAFWRSTGACIHWKTPPYHGAHPERSSDGL